MKTIRFNDPAVFERLEDKAIDGVLDYSDFPPAEYKYFSKLSKIGYNNRVKGWAVEICEKKQKELRADYAREKEEAQRVFDLLKQDNARRIKYNAEITMIYKADDIYGILDSALAALEAVMDEPGFKERIDKKINELYEVTENDRQKDPAVL